MSEIYTVYVILDYREKDDRGNLRDSTEYQVIATSYDLAIEKVKVLNPNHQEFFYLKQVIQNFEPK